MKTYKIENWTIEAKTKRQAVLIYQNQFFDTFMCECSKSFSALYKDAIKLK